MVKWIKRKKPASIIENTLVLLLEMIIVCAMLVVIFGAFASISDKWGMRQVAREYLLIMETEGYLSGTDQANLIADLEGYGLYNVSLAGTTTSEVDYGDRIYLCISGTYDDNILAFAGGISKITENPVRVTINRQTTAKQ